MIPAQSLNPGNITALHPSGKLLLSARGDPQLIAASLLTATGVSLPLEPNTTTGVIGDAARKVLWLGPQRWLLICEPKGVERDKLALESALSGVNHLVSDISAARTGFAVGGHNARDVLAQVCSLDLHPERFPVGACAQTRLAKIPLLIVRVNPGPSDTVWPEADDNAEFHLYVDRSFTRYALDWLHDAAIAAADWR